MVTHSHLFPSQHDEHRFEKNSLKAIEQLLVALDEALSSGKIERGDKILIIAFGAGLTWGATVLEW